MGAAEIGHIIGGFITALIVPAFILVVSNFIPAAKRHPQVLYAICAVIATLAAFIGASVGGNQVDSTISWLLAEAFIYWGYRGAARKARLLKVSGQSS
jgi:lipopolysaccharide export LptBFGC system permease protein LptF